MQTNPSNVDDSRFAYLSDEIRLAPGVTYLNHGSFGPPPACVVEAHQRALAELNANPMEFLVRRWEARLDDAAARLGRFVGTSARNLVFLPNATTAMNVVAASFPLLHGDEVLLNDHEYGSVVRLWKHRAAETGAKVVVARLPYPLTTAEEVVDAILAAVTPRTRLIVVSHVTSPTAVVMPVARICLRAKERGLAVCVDGPHAVAMRDLDLDAVDCDFYCASCHKWLSAPFGSGFLYAHPRHQDRIEPLVRSWGKRTPDDVPASWRDEFLWPGTTDGAAYVAVPAAIEFIENVGVELFRRRTHALAAEARRRIESLTGLPAFVPDDVAWYGSMITLPLPSGDGPSLMRRLRERHGIEIPVVVWNDRRFIRPSFHLYNTTEHLDRLSSCLATELAAERA